MRYLLPIVCLLLTASSAFADEAEDRYAALYGDGIRAYAESRYDDALTHLYRAVAVKPNPFALKLIARSHDFQGNCSARNHVITMLSDLFPRERAPAPQRCAEVGEVRIECGLEAGAVRVDGAFDAPCAATVLLPVGDHVLQKTSMGPIVRVAVKRGTPSVATMLVGPDKWYLDAASRRVVQLPSRWIRPSLLEDPDMPRSFEWKRPKGH